jgi:hypothetical protein
VDASSFGGIVNPRRIVVGGKPGRTESHVTYGRGLFVSAIGLPKFADFVGLR